MMTVRQVSSARGEIFSFDSWICFPQPCTRAVLAAGRPGIQISTLNVLSGPHPTRLHGSFSKNIFKLHILGGKPYGGASLPTRKIFTADPIVWQPESAPPKKATIRMPIRGARRLARTSPRSSFLQKEAHFFRCTLEMQLLK